MNKIAFYLLLLITLYACSDRPSVDSREIPSDEPIQLHPENPHYFLYKGQAIVLITSAEHYGALLNLDFDYATYLQTLAQDGMNYTRIFTGSYFEIPGESFGIANNTLAPEPSKVSTPWFIIVSGMDRKIQYDLSAWNEAYFERLKNFMELASSLDIIVEVTLFSSIYRNEHWDLSPQNPENNINIQHPINRYDAHTLDNGALLGFQEQFARKMVNELNGFDNFFFEIQNEPWADRPIAVYNIVNKEDLRPNDWTYKADFADASSIAWQEQIAQIIAEEESRLSNKHLIAQNYTNFKAPVPEVSELISIINFHYAWPEAVEWNYHFNKVIGFDESGFAGSDDQVYRRQAWQFMLSGGGLYNNLDYSFFPGFENGLGENQAPGGGSSILRQQLKVLRDFLQSMPLEKLNPDRTSVISSPGLIPYVLSTADKTMYAMYLRAIGTTNTNLTLNTGTGTFQLILLNTISGNWEQSMELQSEEGIITIQIDIPDNELALKMIKIES